MRVLHHRLAVSTLSSWERGNHGPERAASVDMLPDLEQLYGLPHGTLLSLVAGHVAQGTDQVLLPPDQMPEGWHHLLAAAGSMAPVRTHAVHHFMTTTNGTATLQSTHVVEALQAGVDHHLIVQETRGTPRLMQVHQARFDGQWWHEGLTAVRLAHPQTLAAGEMHAFTHEWAYDTIDACRETGYHLTTEHRQYLLRVTFVDEVPDEIWQFELHEFGGEQRDVVQLEADGTGTVQIVVLAPATSVYVGIRWT